MLVALGMFLLHNAIDISFFETGPMWVFMLIAGALVGINSRQKAPRASSPAKRVAAFGAVSAIWITAFIAIAIPLAIAESKAQAGDDLIRARHPGAGAKQLLDAYDTLTFANADYLYRAGEAGATPDEIRATLRRAMAANPAAAAYPRRLAELEVRQDRPDPKPVQELFDRSLALDPNDVTARLDYARSLESLGLRAAASEQYEIALQKNEGLSKDEPKRLSGDEVKQVQQKIEQLTR
jgi:hypothetical protein